MQSSEHHQRALTWFLASTSVGLAAFAAYYGLDGDWTAAQTLIPPAVISTFAACLGSDLTGLSS